MPTGSRRPAWAGSNRRQRLPKNWETLRKAVLIRDNYQCQWADGGRLCARPANQCDHIRPGDDNSMTNLRALCEPHHARQSGKQGAAAYHKQRRETRLRFNAPRIEAHPGLG